MSAAHASLVVKLVVAFTLVAGVAMPVWGQGSVTVDVVAQPTKQQATAAEYFFRRGTSRAKRRDPTDAIEELGKSIAAWPTVKALRLRASLLLGKGDVDAALADLGRCIELFPDDATHYQVRAVALQMLGRNAKSIADYDRTIELKPDLVQAWSNRGLAKLNLGDALGALADLDHVVTIAPAYANGYYNRGLVYARQKDFPKAIADFEYALLINPEFGDARYNLEQARIELAKLSQP